MTSTVLDIQRPKTELKYDKNVNIQPIPIHNRKTNWYDYLRITTMHIAGPQSREKQLKQGQDMVSFWQTEEQKIIKQAKLMNLLLKQELLLPTRLSTGEIDYKNVRPYLFSQIVTSEELQELAVHFFQRKTSVEFQQHPYYKLMFDIIQRNLLQIGELDIGTSIIPEAVTEEKEEEKEEAYIEPETIKMMEKEIIERSPPDNLPILSLDTFSILPIHQIKHILWSKWNEINAADAAIVDQWILENPATKSELQLADMIFYLYTYKPLGGKTRWFFGWGPIDKIEQFWWTIDDPKLNIHLYIADTNVRYIPFVDKEIMDFHYYLLKKQLNVYDPIKELITQDNALLDIIWDNKEERKEMLEIVDEFWEFDDVEDQLKRKQIELSSEKIPQRSQIPILVVLPDGKPYISMIMTQMAEIMVESYKKQEQRKQTMNVKIEGRNVELEYKPFKSTDVWAHYENLDNNVIVVGVHGAIIDMKSLANVINQYLSPTFTTSEEGEFCSKYQQLMRIKADNPILRIILTGHSLGAHFINKCATLLGYNFEAYLFAPFIATEDTETARHLASTPEFLKLFWKEDPASKALLNIKFLLKNALVFEVSDEYISDNNTNWNSKLVFLAANKMGHSAELFTDREILQANVVNYYAVSIEEELDEDTDYEDFGEI